MIQASAYHLQLLVIIIHCTVIFLPGFAIILLFLGTFLPDFFFIVLVTVLIAVKRFHDQGNSYKKRKHLIGALLGFRGLVHYHDRKLGSRHCAEEVVESYILIHRQLYEG